MVVDHHLRRPTPSPPLPDSLYVYEFFSTRVAGADAGALSSAAGRA